MKILVTGSRHWKGERIHVISRALQDNTNPGDIVIAGGAPGVDTLAVEAAQALGLRTVVIPAEWDRLGKRAGPIRNSEMLSFWPDKVLAFHENLQESRGTKDCVQKAKAKGYVVKLYDHNGFIGYAP